jgi:hypothetical protein
MRTGTHPYLRRSISLAVAGILVPVLAACTGRGGGYLPPAPTFSGPASLGFTFSCEDKGGLNPPTGQLRIQLAYTDHGSSPIGSWFSIHGIVDTMDPVLESAVCIGRNPPTGGKELIFLGRYRVTSSSVPGQLQVCPTRGETTSFCRFEVIVRDNDVNHAPSRGDYFSIKLSTVTTASPCDIRYPDPTCTQFPPGTPVPYFRAGVLQGGNLTVD